MNKLEMAHNFVEKCHQGQKRKFTGEPYLIHLEETAQLLWEATDGKASHDDYVAALCHDVIENTSCSKEEIGRNFGGKPMYLVAELTNDGDQIRLLGKAIYLSKKINAMSDDAFTIKLCDRLSNVVGLNDQRIPDHFVMKYVKETQYILENLDRALSESQKYLIDRIANMLMFLRLNRTLKEN